MIGRAVVPLQTQTIGVRIGGKGEGEGNNGLDGGGEGHLGSVEPTKHTGGGSEGIG